MQKDNAKAIIVSILQHALVGQLNASSNFKPQHVADAIADKVNFEKRYEVTKQELLIKIIEQLKDQIKEEYEKLALDEKLLKNFIRGKITAYDEIISILTK